MSNRCVQKTCEAESLRAATSPEWRATRPLQHVVSPRAIEPKATAMTTLSTMSDVSAMHRDVNNTMLQAIPSTAEAITPTASEPSSCAEEDSRGRPSALRTSLAS